MEKIPYPESVDLAQFRTSFNPEDIKKKNVPGTQFPPEKSGDVGLEILRNFCES
jgi:imidazoleglycerol phosphate synthase glutamine amidotransferase subunit HisH